MNDDIAPDPSLLARHQRQLLSDMGIIRDYLAVLTTAAMRQDGDCQRLAEVRAMHS